MPASTYSRVLASCTARGRSYRACQRTASAASKRRRRRDRSLSALEISETALTNTMLVAGGAFALGMAAATLLQKPA